MSYRLPAGLVTVQRNTDGPARFTGARWAWVAVIEGRKTFCATREEARAAVAEYRKERAALLRQGERIQARQEFNN